MSSVEFLRGPCFCSVLSILHGCSVLLNSLTLSAHASGSWNSSNFYSLKAFQLHSAMQDRDTDPELCLIYSTNSTGRSRQEKSPKYFSRKTKYTYKTDDDIKCKLLKYSPGRVTKQFLLLDYRNLTPDARGYQALKESLVFIC